MKCENADSLALSYRCITFSWMQ